MQNARLTESQTGIKIARRNINNLRYANDTTNGRKWRGTKDPLDEGERRQWKYWPETQHKKTEIIASSPVTSCQIEGEKVEAVTDFTFLSSKILQPWNYKTFASWKQCYNKPRLCIRMQRYHFTDRVHTLKAIVYPVVMYRCDQKRKLMAELKFSNCGAEEDSWKCFGLQRDQTSQS